MSMGMPSPSTQKSWTKGKISFYHVPRGYCYSHSCNTKKDCKWQHIAKDNDRSLQKHYQTLSAVQVTNWQPLPLV